MTKKVLNSEEIKEFIDKYKQYELTPPSDYIAHYFKVNGATISIFNTGTITIQGNNLEDFSKYLDEKEASSFNDINYDNYNTIGADEVGTGDSFGPIVCASVFVEVDKVSYLKSLGVRDSKELSDDKILTIAPKIINNFKHQVSICRNEVYNDNIDRINLNAMKAKLHNSNIIKLTSKVDYDYVCLDQFSSIENYYSYLGSNAFKNIKFETKGESKSIAVASSSIIARYYLIKEFERLNKIYGYILPKGSGEPAQEMIERIKLDGKHDILYHIAKLNFKNFK